MTTLKSSLASALHLVPHAQEQAYHEDHQYVVSGSQIKREKAIKQVFEIERNQRAHQRSQVDPHQYLDLEQAVNSASLEKDQEIEAPAHYVKGRQFEPIAIVEDWDLNHHLACALKYIARAGRKHDEVKDLRKAVWYLSRRIKRLEQQG